MNVVQQKGVESKMALETITPEKARRFLESNTHNRNLREDLVKKYAKDIQEGNWDINGESIKFSVEGNILDGQHRLWAIVEANVPVQSYVIYNLPKDTFHTIDTGRARSAADILTIGGEMDANKMAASLRLLAAYEMTEGSLKDLASKAAYEKGLTFTTHELYEVLERHPGIRDSIAFMKNVPRMGRMSGYAVAVFCHYLFSQKSRDEADSFFLSLNGGENLQFGDPVLALRNRLIDGKASFRQHSGTVRGSQVDKVALFIKAWNAYRNKSTIKSLRYALWEDYPVPV